MKCIYILLAFFSLTPYVEAQIGIGWLNSNNRLVLEYEINDNYSVNLNGMFSASENPRIYTSYDDYYRQINYESKSFYIELNFNKTILVKNYKSISFFMSPYVGPGYEYRHTINTELEIRSDTVHTGYSDIDTSFVHTIGGEIGLRPEIRFFDKFCIIAFFGIEGEYNIRTLNKSLDKHNNDKRVGLFGEGLTLTSISFIYRFGK